MSDAGPGPTAAAAPGVEGLLEAAGQSLDRLTRAQPDFPRPGVLFRDLTPVLADPLALDVVARALAAAAPQATVVAGLESRGFLFGAAVAMTMGSGVLALRKPGKLPGEVLREDYTLEYGTASLELHPADVPPGSRVLIIDDVLATGGTAAAAVRLVERAGAQVAAVAVAVELAGLGGRAVLDRTRPGVPVHALRLW